MPRQNLSSEIYAQFLGLHGMVSALTCTVNCGTSYRQVCFFINHVQTIELATGELQSSCTFLATKISYLEPKRVLRLSPLPIWELFEEALLVPGRTLLAPKVWHTCMWGILSADPLKLCQVGWGGLLHSYFQLSPEMFDRVQVWALAGPLKDVHRLGLKPLLRCLGWVLRVVGLLEGEPSPQSEVLSALEQVFIEDPSLLCSVHLCLNPD